MRKTQLLFLSVAFLVPCFSAPLFAEELVQNLSNPPPVTSTFDVVKVFQSCPIIYSLLLLMSIISLTVWLYSMLTLRLADLMPKDFITHIREFFMEKRYEAALTACQQEGSFAAGIIAAGILSRKHGPQLMLESMKSEGKRSSNSLWQRISLLNEIAVVSPMLGLLGTVIGLFFAFYDSNRSAESISAIFDGLGIAVGTTVMGLIVSILSMIFYTTLKFRVVGLLTTIENESLSLVSLVEAEPPLHSNKFNQY